MMGADLVTAAVSPYVTALIGIAGTAIGGAIAYRLMQLRWETLGDGPRLGGGAASDVAVTVRDARHGVLDAIRREIGVTESMKPEGYFNPFDGTAFAARYRELHPPRETDRPPVGP
jgi:hypothetical protein